MGISHCKGTAFTQLPFFASYASPICEVHHTLGVPHTAPVYWLQSDAARAALHPAFDSCRLAEAAQSPRPAACFPHSIWPRAKQPKPRVCPITCGGYKGHEGTPGNQLCPVRVVVGFCTIASPAWQNLNYVGAQQSMCACPVGVMCSRCCCSCSICMAAELSHTKSACWCQCGCAQDGSGGSV